MTTERRSPNECVPQEAPKPPWAVALDKMRDYYGNKVVEDVTLTPDEAYAFVQHYLHTSELLDVTEAALRERNARLDRIERMARGEAV